MSKVKEDEREEISGNTLRVYWYILKKGENCGVREIQRALGFSSSNSAHYHLERLADKGFVVKNEHGSYQVNARIRTGTISNFVFVHGLAFPRQLVYAIMTTLMNALFLTFSMGFLSLTVAVALLPGIFACIVFWYETIRIWSNLPSFRESVQ